MFTSAAFSLLLGWGFSLCSISFYLAFLDNNSNGALVFIP